MNSIDIFTTKLANMLLIGLQELAAKHAALSSESVFSLELEKMKRDAQTFVVEFGLFKKRVHAFVMDAYEKDKTLQSVEKKQLNKVVLSKAGRGLDLSVKSLAMAAGSFIVISERYSDASNGFSAELIKNLESIARSTSSSILDEVLSDMFSESVDSFGIPGA